MNQPASHGDERRRPAPATVAYYGRLLFLLGAGMAPVLAGLAALEFLGGKSAAPGFYSTSAEILPLILLVVVLERGFVFRPQMISPSLVGPIPERPAPSSWLNRVFSAPAPSYQSFRRIVYVYSVMLLVLLGVGEWAALYALATERPGEHHFSLVAAGLAAGFTAIVVLALLGAVRKGSEGDDRYRGEE